MAKFSVLGLYPAERIPDVVPPDYRTRTRMSVEPGSAYTVVLFAHDRMHGGVVTSSAVGKALGRVPDAEPILAVGADFTREATELLGRRGAVIVRIGEFGWTDEAWHSRHL